MYSKIKVTSLLKPLSFFNLSFFLLLSSGGEKKENKYDNAVKK